MISDVLTSCKTLYIISFKYSSKMKQILQISTIDQLFPILLSHEKEKLQTTDAIKDQLELVSVVSDILIVSRLFIFLLILVYSFIHDCLNFIKVRLSRGRSTIAAELSNSFALEPLSKVVGTSEELTVHPSQEVQIRHFHLGEVTANQTKPD